MRGPRLTRSKTGDAALARDDHESRAVDVFTFKASFDDLRRPDGRQKLREQLSSQFPESYASSLKSSPSATDMAGRDWLTVGQDAAAKSSSSSVESPGHAPNRLSAVPERNMAAIDVEQAIHLLTELKKTATPEQLVALHKALLPTRDSIISNADSSAGQRGSMIRQKSMLPAGLATRGGASDDLLKRQEDVKPVVKVEKNDRHNGHHRLQSKSSIAALDLADDAANPLSAQRAATPSEQQQYFGAYRPGTLRITNGAASPEPTLRTRTGGGISSVTVRGEHETTGRSRAGSDAKAFAETRSMHEVALDDLKQRIESNTGETASAGPLSKLRDPSQSRQYRAQRSQEPLHSNTATPLIRSREPSLSRQPLNVETKASKPNLAAAKKVSSDTLARRSLDFSRRSIDSIRKSIDDGRVSPIDAPRFFQRWSHRASQISQEYTTECEVVSPFEDRQSASAFAQRLSTVYDREDAENTANETPEAALSKLEGKVEPIEEREGHDTRGRRNSAHSEERLSLRATATGLNASRPPLVTSYTDPRPVPKKADSGYVSDASHRSLQPTMSHEVDTNQLESSATREQTHEQPGHREIVHRVEGDSDDVQSLYTLEQMLKMPSLPSTPSTPARPDAVRKHSSLLKLASLKKTTLAAPRTPLNPNSSADSLPLPAELGGSSPVESRSPRPAKKLQKRMPEEVKRQRKEQREKAKQSSLTLATQYVDAMDMPTDLSELASSPAPVSEFADRSNTTWASSPLARRASTPAEALSELVGDSQHPAELDTDESATAPKRSLSRKQSKKSRRRSRRSTGPPADAEDKAQINKKRSFSLGRKRSQSKRRSGSLTPKRKSQEPAVPSIAALSASWDDNGSQESLPMYSDYNSVARSLGTNPYDISTAQFKKDSRGSSPVLDQLQSPHQISTQVSRTKTGGLRGMDDSMARDFARMKSRDVAIQNNEDVFDRPRMATPNKRSQQDTLRSRSTMPNALMVEQRTPEWNAKPVSRKSSFDSVHSASQQRPHSIAESIPSLPELPVDAETRAVKAAEYLARRNKDMQHASPVLAESPSPAVSPNLASTEQPGFSNESVADAVAKAMEARRPKRTEHVKQSQKPERLRPLGPRMNSDASSSSGKVSLQLHGIDSRPHSDASASILIGVGSDRDNQEERPKTASVEQDDAAALSVWERQAQMWQKRRESIGQTLGKPVEEGDTTDSELPTASPSIVVSPSSRNVTPSARDSLPSADWRKSASEHANAYRDLIGNENDSFDDIPHNAHRASTQSASTVTNRSSTSTVVVGNAPPAKAYQATLIHRSRSPGGRVRTPSGSYHPYSPNHALQAEQSRAGRLAQLEGQAARSTRSLDVPRRAPHHQQADTLESILGRYDRTLSPVPASEAGSIESPDPKPSAPRAAPVLDRYGGGLQYGYERGVGLRGSSGLRTGVEATKVREGNRFSEQFGVDLGDVPVFLRRAR